MHNITGQKGKSTTRIFFFLNENLHVVEQMATARNDFRCTVLCMNRTNFRNILSLIYNP